MKGKVFWITVVAGCLAMTGVASAHLFGPNGEGNPFFVPAVPEEYIPTYDGDLSDWAWYPPAYIATPESFIAMGNFNDAEQAVPKDDFDVIIYGPAWIPSLNMMTWAVHKVDDIFSTRSDIFYDSFNEDVVQFAIDADHGGDVAETNTEYQQAGFSPKLGGMMGVYGGSGGLLDWAFQEPYAFFGMKPAIVEGTNGTFDVEVQHYIWDHLDPAGEGASTRHQLQAGQIIGYTVEVIDTEEGVEEFPDVEFDFGNSAIGGEVLCDWYLMSVEETMPLIPTAVQNDSWGRIKQAFTE